MPSPDDIPSLAQLRQMAGRRRPSNRTSDKPASQDVFPSLFDLPTHEEIRAKDTTSPGLSEDEPPALDRGASLRREVPATPHIWTVAALVREVRGFVERSYGQLTVEGEISNWRIAGSGHCYFTLKDGDAQLAAVMFRRSASLLRFNPKDGDAVRLRGQISIYENRGQMQLIAESMELAGQGALLAAVQRLKENLKREGLFDRKRSLPPFPECIGVITSLRGAALQDIIKVCRRRHAAVKLLIYPAAVQGPRCAFEVIAGLRWFSRHPERADVVLVARGGGSWEDLHGFNDEGVARAIAACPLPVLTGIGHEIDTTIADAAADVCAPTPSAAAELLTAAQHRVEERVERLLARVLRAGRYEVLRARQRLGSAGADAALRRSHDQLRRREQRMDELELRAESGAARNLSYHREKLLHLTGRLQMQEPGFRLAENSQRLRAMRYRLEQRARSIAGDRERTVQHIVARLRGLSPLHVLDRGYALVYGADGRLLRSADTVQPQETITARLSSGSLMATVQSVRCSPGEPGHAETGKPVR